MVFISLKMCRNETKYFIQESGEYTVDTIEHGLQELENAVITTDTNDEEVDDNREISHDTQQSSHNYEDVLIQENKKLFNINKLRGSNKLYEG